MYLTACCLVLPAKTGSSQIPEPLNLLVWHFTNFCWDRIFPELHYSFTNKFKVNRKVRLMNLHSCLSVITLFFICIVFVTAGRGWTLWTKRWTGYDGRSRTSWRTGNERRERVAWCSWGSGKCVDVQCCQLVAVSYSSFMVCQVWWSFVTRDNPSVFIVLLLLLLLLLLSSSSLFQFNNIQYMSVKTSWLWNQSCYNNHTKFIHSKIQIQWWWKKDQRNAFSK
jgi:hypothetical protein